MIRPNTLLFFTLREKFTKAQSRLENAIATGRFSKMSRTKQLEIFNRLNRYARQLGARLKPGIVTAFVTAGLFFASAASAQTFTEITGASNPLNGKTVSDLYSKPCFADINNDGDKDLFAGRSYADITRFTNTGTASAAVFDAGTLLSNAGIANAAPFLVDIDNDGDKDMFVGSDNGTVYYYPNTGNATTASFAYFPIEWSPISGYTNPLSAITLVNWSSPAFADIDNDGDKDCFIGNINGTIYYYKNTGTAALPVFTLQAGASNPFNGVDVGSNASPAFADIDNDGDLDAIIGNSGGALLYYKNTGTASAAVFTQQTGGANPFNGVATAGGYSAPAFADIDNDGDQDLFSGNGNGAFQFFKNNLITLPVVWQNFYAQKTDNQQVLLNWTTASEINSKDFVVEHSTDAITWDVVGTVPATGNSSVARQYSFVHAKPGAMNYYRLQQRDMNGKSSYSGIRIVRFSGNDASFSILSTQAGNGMLQLQLTYGCVLSLYNNSGQLLMQKKLDAGFQVLDLSKYPKGGYYLRGADQTERFILQ